MSSSNIKREKRGKQKKRCSGYGVFEFRERRCSFSLEYWAIRPSAVFGTRRKAALRREAYAWVPDLRSLDKLREVGVSPYLVFTLYLNVFQCFDWIEALNDRLISPKTWDRIVVIFFKGPFLHSPWVGAVWVYCVLIYVLNGALVCIGPVMVVKPGFIK